MSHLPNDPSSGAAGVFPKTGSLPSSEAKGQTKTHRNPETSIKTETPRRQLQRLVRIPIVWECRHVSIQPLFREPQLERLT